MDVDDNIVDGIFADDFESGDLSAWSYSSTDSGNLAASGYSDYYGFYGMEALIDDTNSIYAKDSTPANETRYRARFYFNPNSLDMASGDNFTIIGAYNASQIQLGLQIRDNAGTYQTRFLVTKDDSSWDVSSWYNLTDGWNAIEIDWMAASALTGLRHAPNCEPDYCALAG